MQSSSSSNTGNATTANQHQDWAPVTWSKRTNSAGTAADRAAAAARSSETHARAQRLHRLAEAKEFAAALQSARLAKKMTQKALALSVSEKQALINDYESGKAVPSQAVVAKLNRALAVQLPSALGGKPKKKR